MRLSLALAAAMAALASPALADVGVSLGLSITGESEIKIVKYDCDDHSAITVQYINAGPNDLAVVPVKEGTLVFAGVVAGSGTKYVAGPYEWFTKGQDASLQDVTEGLDAAPVMGCSEENDTP
jgi:membrane-bound inhibitor of C-type lysozyme